MTIDIVPCESFIVCKYFFEDSLSVIQMKMNSVGESIQKKYYVFVKFIELIFRSGKLMKVERVRD